MRTDLIDRKVFARLIIALSIIVILIACQKPAAALEARLDPGSRVRVQRLLPYVSQASYNTGVPADLMVGILYNESNARADAIGDNGTSFGLAQIRCTKSFSWVKTLNKQFPSITRCEHLLDAEMAVYSLAAILERYMNKGLNRKKVIKAYHLGYPPNNIDDSAYRGRVEWFAKYFSYNIAAHRFKQRVMAHLIQLRHEINSYFT